MELLAYIDPGAGSLFIQAAIATIVVVPFFLRSQVRRGLDRIRGRQSAAIGSAEVGTRDDITPPAKP